jgi:hypothetical protein
MTSPESQGNERPPRQTEDLPLVGRYVLGRSREYIRKAGTTRLMPEMVAWSAREHVTYLIRESVGMSHVGSNEWSIPGCGCFKVGRSANQLFSSVGISNTVAQRWCARKTWTDVVK